MMNRRQFLSASAAGVAMLAHIPKLFAQSLDLIIKGGRVIDPSVGLDAIRDVAIAHGRIAAVEALRLPVVEALPLAQQRLQRVYRVTTLKRG